MLVSTADTSHRVPPSHPGATSLLPMEQLKGETTPGSGKAMGFQGSGCCPMYFSLQIIKLAFWVHSICEFSLSLPLRDKSSFGLQTRKQSKAWRGGGRGEEQINKQKAKVSGFAKLRVKSWITIQSPW